MSLNRSTEERKDPDQPCFTKKEVRDIIFERNELKTNLFLVQEELSYYQRSTFTTFCGPEKLHSFVICDLKIILVFACVGRS